MPDCIIVPPSGISFTSGIDHRPVGRLPHAPQVVRLQARRLGDECQPVRAGIPRAIQRPLSLRANPSSQGKQAARFVWHRFSVFQAAHNNNTERNCRSGQDIHDTPAVGARPHRAITRWPHTPVKSRRSGDKTGHPGFHHCVEPDVCRDAVANLPHCVVRQGRYLEVLLNVARFG